MHTLCSRFPSSRSRDAASRGCYSWFSIPQIHYQQYGIFHVITKTRDDIPWCTRDGVPNLLIRHLCTTRDIEGALLHAFCILPNHVHLILCPGSKGLSRFMQSFKSNSVKELHMNSGLKDIRWQVGFYDERIRDGAQRAAAMGYVLGNGMKHGLVDEVTKWPWTSLHFPEAVDLLELW